LLYALISGEDEECEEHEECEEEVPELSEADVQSAAANIWGGAAAAGTAAAGSAVFGASEISSAENHGAGDAGGFGSEAASAAKDRV